MRRDLSTGRNGQPVRFADSSFERAPIAFTAATWWYDVLPLGAVGAGRTTLLLDLSGGRPWVQLPPGGYMNHAVEPRLDVITLAVADLELALAFYRRLGFESNGIVGTEWADEVTGAHGAIAMFRLEGGLLLNLYPRADLAKDAAIPVVPPQSGAFSLAQLVRSRGEVDELLARAAAAGATVTPAHDRPWGIYSGYFHDPDGHLWEIIWHPDGVPKPR